MLNFPETIPRQARCILAPLMVGFLVRSAINGLGLLFISKLVPGIRVETFGVALATAMVLGLANATIRPLLYAIAKKATCALTCVTLGLWSLVLSWLISATLFYAASWLLAPRFHVENFAAAMKGALLMAVINLFATAVTSGEKKKDER